MNSWIERAKSKTATNPATGCWEYFGEIVKNGYGRVWNAGKNVSLHRLSYFHYRGKIPTGLFVCHSCDVRNCWNPDHLFVGTHQDNMNDMVAKGRSRASEDQRGEANNKAKLTAENVREIRQMAASGITHRECGLRFGVSIKQVANIVNRRNWRHVEALPLAGQSHSQAGATQHV